MIEYQVINTESKRVVKTTNSIHFATQVQKKLNEADNSTNKYVVKTKEYYPEKTALIMLLSLIPVLVWYTAWAFKVI